MPRIQLHVKRMYFDIPNLTSLIFNLIYPCVNTIKYILRSVRSTQSDTSFCTKEVIVRSHVSGVDLGRFTGFPETTQNKKQK